MDRASADDCVYKDAWLMRRCLLSSSDGKHDFKLLVLEDSHAAF